MDSARILVIDDEPAMLENCERLLTHESYVCETLSDALRFRQVAREFQPDVVVTDLRMPGADGMTILATSAADDPARPVILMTAFATVASAVSAVREGAFDYITKPFTADQLSVAVGRAVRYRDLTVENRTLRHEVARTGGDGILGASPVMVRLLEQVEKVAPTSASVLLTGESGTGKEVIARFVHSRSLRREHPFVAVDCAAMPEGLLESELFGHARGAFTGAVQANDGLLVKANGGTVFLDEIGEMGSALQVKLLRTLEQRQMRRVGAARLIELDIRIIAATNRDLEAAVEDGSFREDLYYRLNVVHFNLPPLRERTGDVAVLMNAFVAEFARAGHRRPPTVTPDAMLALERHHWPGNVRELRNVAQRLVVLDDDGRISASDIEGTLPPARPGAVATDSDDAEPVAYDAALERAVRAFRADYVGRLLERHGGNVSRAAAAGGVSRRTLHRWLADLQRRPDTDGIA